MKTWMKLSSICTLAVCATGAFAQTPAPAHEPKAKVAQQPTTDILDTAVVAGSFKTLAAALQAAGLVETLKGKGPFTVFAPTDEAFAKLPAGTVESLLKPENKEKLASILKFHVIQGAAYADQVVAMTESKKTLEGQTFQIKVREGKVTIGNGAAMAGVTNTDLEASNGVIHVIDTVLMPK